jgi:hypothetical protein
MMMNTFDMLMIMIFGVASLSLLLLSLSHSDLMYARNADAEEARCINYDIYTNTITISCDANLSQIDNAVNDKTVLEKDPHGIWILNAIIKVNPHAKLIINRADTSWLKITNKIFQETEPNYISISGIANIEGVKITSWDPFSDDVIRQNVNGSVPRPYIVIDKGTANISSSELSFLGFATNPSSTGLSYQHGGNSSRIINNTFHDMWDGFHSNFARFITIEGNKYYNVLRNGISIFQSSNIKMNNNIVKSSHIGIRIARISSDNDIYNNTIADSTFGLYFSDGHPRNNLFKNNNLNNISYPIKVDGINNIGRNNKIYNNS